MMINIYYLWAVFCEIVELCVIETELFTLLLVVTLYYHIALLRLNNWLRHINSMYTLQQYLNVHIRGILPQETITNL